MKKIEPMKQDDVREKPVGPNWWGHQMDAKDVPTLDDDGEYSSYAKCSKCGAIENTDESVQVCPKAEYVHISVYRSHSTSLLQKMEGLRKEFLTKEEVLQTVLDNEGNVDSFEIVEEDRKSKSIYNQALSDCIAMIKKEL